jgi:hypothetical protein
MNIEILFLAALLLTGTSLLAWVAAQGIKQALRVTVKQNKAVFLRQPVDCRGIDLAPRTELQNELPAMLTKRSGDIPGLH